MEMLWTLSFCCLGVGWAEVVSFSYHLLFLANYYEKQKNEATEEGEAIISYMFFNTRPQLILGEGK